MRHRRTNRVARSAWWQAWVLVTLVLAAPQARPAHEPDQLPRAQAYLHYSLGRLLEVNGAFADALVQYRRANALTPGSCDIETAVARVQYALGNLDGALEKTEAALARCPGNLETRALRAEVMLVAGAYEDAELLVGDLARSDEAPRNIVALYGQALLSQGRLEEGEEYLRQRARIDSLDADVASMRGRVLLLLGDADAAVDELARAVRLDPGDRAAAGMLSRLLVALERPEEGVPILEGLVSGQGPTEPEYISLAQGYSMLGEHERARDVLAKASERYGETAGILRARGATCYDSGDIEEAMTAYERLLAIDEDSVVALNFMAYTLADENRELDRALDYANRAVELDGDSPIVRDTLGWTHYRLGNLDEARRELELAVELGADSAIILEHLGDVLRDLGLPEEAVTAWKRALELSPESPSAAARLRAAGIDPDPPPDGGDPAEAQQ